MVLIKAEYKNDKSQYMVFEAKLTSDDRLSAEHPIKGYALEWEQAASRNTRWPFIVSPDEGHIAFIEWTSSEQVTEINLMNRHISVGATFLRTDGLSGGKSEYEIVSIVKQA
jgi:hypothetical protein